MISVHEALDLIMAFVQLQAAESCNIDDACGRVLAEPVISSMQLPLFDNSAMDGYALKQFDVAMASEAEPVVLKLAGVIAAGESADSELNAGQAIQIFTGAMVPPGADAVIRQEDINTTGDTIVIKRPVRPNENIRFAGEETRVGDPVLPAGLRLTPAGIGVLASLGLKSVSVYAMPRVGILVTGSETVTNPSDLVPGKIFDSNSFILSAALQQLGLRVEYREHSADDRAELAEKISRGLEVTDILLITGGVSVGQFDYVKELATSAGVREVFWRVKQKPGKPLFFGVTKDQKKLLFGLPGNPASVLVSFYEYVRPAILKTLGQENLYLPCIQATLRAEFKKPAGLKHFLKGQYSNNGTVKILEGQGSHIISSFACANCLVVIDEDVTEIKKGEQVEVHLLPA